jgi:D-alanyl-lipoteichoic acid acyltransferase DltB (MBOAT superfamily)
MPFNSLKYFLFLPVVYLVFYFVGERARWFVLLAASLLFYAALNVPYLLFVLILVAITTYGFGIWLDQADTPKAKRTLLWGGIATNVLILVVMKYLPFLTENVKELSTLLSLDAQVQPVKAFVAIGVSYYVFQAISYLFDIYLEIEKPERHFGYFALYLAFFPKLLQGPIERAGDLIPQLKKRYEFNYDNMRFGMLLFAWGLFKKVVIADRLGLYVDAVYNDVHAFTGLPLLLATYAYAFQIFMDFSGYTDMALGSARLFNINLTQNFNSPYLATSVADFWRRWHITFSRWILDYIFKPLQMQWRNWKSWGTATALMVAFIISGIWHGASWGFVIWGGLHGLYMACSVFYKPFQKKLHKALGIEKTKSLKAWQIFVTFNLVSFAWVFFRANNLVDALYVINRMSNDAIALLSGASINVFLEDIMPLAHDKTNLIIIACCMIAILIVNKNRRTYNFTSKSVYIRWSMYYLLMFSIMFLGLFKNTQKFIYFKF